MTLPVLHLTGSPFEQGMQQGRQLKDRIGHNLAVYFDRFEHEVKLTRAEVLARASQYAAAIERLSPAYFDGMRGIAEGSGFSFEEIVALNVRYEILYYRFGVIAMVDGCTAFAVLPAATTNGHLLIGQNWDWIPQIQGAVLHTVEADGLETISFTESGIFGGKIGFNSAGIGLAINGMTTTADDWERMTKPFHVRCYDILRQHDFDAAVKVVTDEQRACSTNFLIAQTPNRVIDIEAAPDKLKLLQCENNCLVHTNHFVDPQGLGIVEPPNERRPHSYHRRVRMRELLESQAQISIADLEGFLQDHEEHPFSICRHINPEEPPEEHYITVTGVVIDLDARVMHLSDGPPCEHPYQTVELLHLP